MLYSKHKKPVIARNTSLSHVCVGAITFVLRLLLSGASVDDLHSLGVRLELSDVEHRSLSVDAVSMARLAPSFKPPCATLPAGRRPGPAGTPLLLQETAGDRGRDTLCFQCCVNMVHSIDCVSFFAEAPQDVLAPCGEGLDDGVGLVLHALMIAHFGGKVNPLQPLSQLAQGPGG